MIKACTIYGQIYRSKYLFLALQFVFLLLAVGSARHMEVYNDIESWGIWISQFLNICALVYFFSIFAGSMTVGTVKCIMRLQQTGAEGSRAKDFLMQSFYL